MKQFSVSAVGTDNGRPVVFVKEVTTDPKAVAAEMVVPTDTVTMAKLAGLGVELKHTNEVAVRRRRV